MFGVKTILDIIADNEDAKLILVELDNVCEDEPYKFDRILEKLEKSSIFGNKLVKLHEIVNGDPDTLIEVLLIFTDNVLNSLIDGTNQRDIYTMLDEVKIMQAETMKSAWDQILTSAKSRIKAREEKRIFVANNEKPNYDDIFGGKENAGDSN